MNHVLYALAEIVKNLRFFFIEAREDNNIGLIR